MKTIYEIIYDVDDDTQERIDAFNELDEFRDEQSNRSETIAVFDSRDGAEEYLKQMQIAYDLAIKNGDEPWHTVYNPEACCIWNKDILEMKDAQAAFKKEIEKYNKEPKK